MVPPAYGGTTGGVSYDVRPNKVSGSPRDHDAPDDWHKSRRLQLLFVLTAISSSKKLIPGTYVGPRV
jgi:hypothetical protein